MDLLIKENIENQGGTNARRKKGNVPFDGIKKLKTMIKPLSDVKNIIEDKVNPEQMLKGVPVKSNLLPVIAKDSCNDELCFYSEYDDNYEDIIPKSLQLEGDDISKLVSMFYLPPKKRQEEQIEFLPALDFEMTFGESVNEDLCDIIKGIDSTCLLFDDLS